MPIKFTAESVEYLVSSYETELKRAIDRELEPKYAIRHLHKAVAFREALNNAGWDIGKITVKLINSNEDEPKAS